MALVPKRLGLKYRPVPTLAVEYEGVDHALHVEVIELPDIHLRSTATELLKRVQTSHEVFRSSVVNHEQLTRLLEQLISETTRPAEPPLRAEECMPPAPQSDFPPAIVERPTPVEVAPESDDEEAAESAEEDETPPPAMKIERIDEPQRAVMMVDRDVLRDAPQQTTETVQTTPARAGDDDENELAKSASEEEESFEESFMEESVEASVDRDADVRSEVPATADDPPPVTALEPVAAPAPEPVKAAPVATPTPALEESNVEESMEEITSEAEEELDYFSGGDDSGDDEGF
ncbi:hypothetical protein SDRG_09812 [Saprolegnia diclina VS20]|uniref:Uncharacterized protein n=1 Tax=Saprolegnia diclina (strain VS20) TaxID=1156394 RepID=T0QFY5_SAPDV|nr:hypothetical protein SDRG_09812 [Saprolegnia diclina VS20]EQC32485.1 hypothetical protein SDRG_09812 [Saprolegnia diclina VS20]|eukprot:XP_008613986.1 hypothetical protein SDRG_09812 [Saprolegnia diclina VS20]